MFGGVEIGTMSQQTKLDASPPVSVLPCVADISFGEAVENNGVRNVAFTHDGANVNLTIPGATLVFEPSSLIEGASRLNLTMRLGKEWDDAFDCFEASIVHAVCEDTARFFGSALPAHEVAEMYKAVTRKTGDFPRNLKVKITVGENRNRTRFWDMDKKPLEQPSSFSGLRCNARINLRGLWFSDANFGLVCDCTDLQILGERQSEAECPF